MPERMPEEIMTWLIDTKLTKRIFTLTQRVKRPFCELYARMHHHLKDAEKQHHLKTWHFL